MSGAPQVVGHGQTNVEEIFFTTNVPNILNNCIIPVHS